MPETETLEPLTPHEALVFAMVLVSAADRTMTDRELKTIGRIVTAMPAFVGFDHGSLSQVAERCVAVLQRADGLERAFALISAALTPSLCETAYAFACDVVAADGRASQEELRVLELMRHRLDIERLVAAAIERGARARHARLG
ncbi:tellurite resistance TerB family protein [Elioraea tepida]|uniref:Tellurite resistance TerB family protein n=1 Tax=Elioraea tepida TaxID=2843330 RepID=A0A975YIP8_9PROT|nr:tellurite resistance TerB family protein [Elioraea tepida]QXM23632.1 tellurite resistance TerB family protein [Elioraea tepida]